jgi:hypothetical protein
MDLGNASGDNGLGARRGTTLKTARLESNVHCCLPGFFSRLPQGYNLGVV